MFKNPRVVTKLKLFLPERFNLLSFFREDNKVSHYIINKMQQAEQTRYRIGDQIFTDLPALLNFYKVHNLDTTPHIRPATKRVEKEIGKYDFEGSVSCCLLRLFCFQPVQVANT